MFLTDPHQTGPESQKCILVAYQMPVNCEVGKSFFSAGPALARRERRPYGIRIENAGYGHVYGLDSTQSKVPVFRSQKPWPGFSTTLLILEPQLPRADFMKLA